MPNTVQVWSKPPVLYRMTFRLTGHGLAGAPVDGRTLAAARLAHTLAKRATVLQDRAPGAFSYMDAANAAQIGEGGGSIKKWMKALTIALHF